MSFKFKRGIDDRFVKRLNAEYEREGWWWAIASDPDLFIAIRNDYLNVYWRGNSLLKLELDGDRLVGKIHYKYLLRPDSTPLYIALEGSKVSLAERASALFLGDLSDVNALKALKRAAGAYAGDERKGVHRIVLRNHNIVDVEVAFGRPEAFDLEDGEESPSTRRIDFTALQHTAEDAELVFYEAKQFSNKELRAKGEISPVVKQISKYEKLLHKHSVDIVRSYRRVCGNLVDLKGVQERYPAMRDIMHRLSTEKMSLRVNGDVRLVVFGFDRDQREGRAWEVHHQKLIAILGNRLLMKGNAQGLTRGITPLQRVRGQLA